MNNKDINRAVASLVLLATGVMAQTNPTPATRSDAEIRKVLADRIGTENNGAGIAVGVVDANGRRVVAYGSPAKNDNRKLDGDSVFEIGSMTKVFTSLVLMDMVRRGEVALSDPISKYLPASVRVPE